MICIFEVLSPENHDFKRLIHIGTDHTFEDLHEIIQNSCDYDQSQVASFFIIDCKGRRALEISSIDSAEYGLKMPSIQKTKLNEHIKEVGQKLIYMFDFFNERYFHIELKGKIMKTDLKEPFVAYENGKAPAQFFISDFDSPEVDLLESNEPNQSFGDLEDYYEIFGEMET